MTVTQIRARLTNRHEATPESQRIAELEAMLNDPRYAGWTEELQAARTELVALTAEAALAA